MFELKEQYINWYFICPREGEKGKRSEASFVKSQLNWDRVSIVHYTTYYILNKTLDNIFHSCFSSFLAPFLKWHGVEIFKYFCHDGLQCDGYLEIVGFINIWN